MKKRLVLKPQVKRLLVKIVLTTVLTTLVIAGYNYTQKGINDCVEAGNDIKMCEKGLL